MPGKHKPIQCKSFVRMNGDWDSVDSLTPEERAEFAEWLAVTPIKALFGDRAVEIKKE